MTHEQSPSTPEGASASDSLNSSERSPFSEESLISPDRSPNQPGEVATKPKKSLRAQLEEKLPRNVRLPQSKHSSVKVKPVVWVAG